MKNVILVLIELITVLNVLKLVQPEVQFQIVQSLLPILNLSMLLISLSDLLGLLNVTVDV
jgi:ABC-type polysaccharide/polyol phosphate export permease